MRIAKPEDFAQIRTMIDKRIADMIERTCADAQAFAASPAYGRAICEIVAKGTAALARMDGINPRDRADL